MRFVQVVWLFLKKEYVDLVLFHCGNHIVVTATLALDLVIGVIHLANRVGSVSNLLIQFESIYSYKRFAHTVFYIYINYCTSSSRRKAVVAMFCAERSLSICHLSDIKILTTLSVC